MTRPLRHLLAALVLAACAAPAAACDFGPEKIYFKSGSHSLSADSRPILDMVVHWKDAFGGGSHLWLRSHTDRVGDGRSNLRLSRKRGEAVRDYLVRHGFPASRIAIINRGEAMAPIPTPDETREPRNNLVLIELVTAKEAATWRSNGTCG